ncbi:glycosyltransferase family 4 protein [Methylothermus subterraneus]
MNTVLYIASRSDIAGGEIYLRDVFQHLDRSRFRPLVVLPGDGAFRNLLDEMGVEWVIQAVNYGWLKPPLPWYSFLAELPQRVRNLVRLIEENQVALVHTNSNQILEGALAAKLAGVHHLIVVHIPFQSNLPIYQRFPLNPHSFAELIGDLSSRIIAVAEPVARSLSPPIPREKIRVIHNGIELERFQTLRQFEQPSIRQELGIPQNAPLITGVGRLHPDKGFEYFVEAAGKVAREFPEAHFAIVGSADSSDYQARLKARVQALGIDRCFHFLGFRQDIPTILTQSDVFLLTSRTEGGPYVLIEAMACGCACVASRCGGFVEYVIRPGHTGFLVEYGDPESAADALRELLRNPGLRQQIAKQGREFVLTCGEFDVRHSVQKLMDVYEDVLSLPSPAAGSYAVDLLLQGAIEIGYLGQKITAMEERLTKAERVAALMLENPLVKAARTLKSKLTS